jgi:hypothetical protein
MEERVAVSGGLILIAAEPVPLSNGSEPAVPQAKLDFIKTFL